jgi:hypothetical protein
MYTGSREQRLYSFVLFQKVFCGHEYSLQNLAFGLHVEPDNKHIQDKIAWCRSVLNPAAWNSLPEPGVNYILLTGMISD